MASNKTIDNGFPLSQVHRSGSNVLAGLTALLHGAAFVRDYLPVVVSASYVLLPALKATNSFQT